MEHEKKPTIYVLDTSVIIYDYQVLDNFADNKVIIPIVVLEELDTFKKGDDAKNASVRGFVRFLDKASVDTDSLKSWISFSEKGGEFKIAMEGSSATDANKVFGRNSTDHRILNIVQCVAGEYPDHKVILISKDVNLRLKAKALDIPAQDYETGKIKADNIHTGSALREGVSSEVIAHLYEHGTCSPQGAGIVDPARNYFYILRNGKKSALTSYDAESNQLKHIQKMSVSSINPLNAEQVFAMSALTNPNIKLVTLQGVAGTGKTLLALASALDQRKDYRQIYLARPIVPLGNRDIGFLPGDIKSKINPYMEPLWDNLKFIKSQFPETGKEAKAIQQMVDQEKLLITPLAYIRGRSLSNIFFIIDEAQNLTPHEVKTIITRAGENTKIVFTGDIYQIDTPYLDTESNGLSYLISRVKGYPLSAHITLKKGERSELANMANELL